MNIEEIIEEIKSNPVEEKGHIYHRIPFPEFDELTTSSKVNGVSSKWKTINAYSNKVFGGDLTDKKVLDVGSNAGFYTFSFAKKGTSVHSFECHDRYSHYGKVIAEEKQLAVNWIPEAFTSSSLAKDDRYDIALLLSVFQWMAEGDINNQEARASLRSISEHSDYLFFELGYNKGKSCVKTDKFNHYAELVRFLEEVTVYKSFKLIAKTRIWGGHSRFLVLCSNNPQMVDSGYSKLLRKFTF